MALVQSDVQRRAPTERPRAGLLARLKLRDDDRRAEFARRLLQAGGYVADSPEPEPSPKGR